MKEKGSDSFHDNEMGDIFDLYNACNGVVTSKGLLDVSKLEELNADEVEFLDVNRLKQVGEHMASGCAQCFAIVSNLNSVRYRVNIAESGRDMTQSVNTGCMDSPWKK